MKPSNEESFILLSKNNAKVLLVRNAMNQASLKKESRLLEKERNSEERLFLKAREHLLQQQSARICETAQRPSSSCSFQPEGNVVKWKSEISLAGELSPRPRRKEFDGNHSKGHMPLSSSFPLLSEGTAKISSPRSRRKALPSLNCSHTASSLPDIHTTSNGTTGAKKYTETKRTSQLSNKEKSDDWKELQKCRYLRTHSTEKDC
ncbi:uncharacterized protein LOC144633360 [Oculina patagonica]